MSSIFYHFLKLIRNSTIHAEIGRNTFKNTILLSLGKSFRHFFRGEDKLSQTCSSYLRQMFEIRVGWQMISQCHLCCFCRQRETRARENHRWYLRWLCSGFRESFCWCKLSGYSGFVNVECFGIEFFDKGSAPTCSWLFFEKIDSEKKNRKEAQQMAASLTWTENYLWQYAKCLEVQKLASGEHQVLRLFERVLE